MCVRESGVTLHRPLLIHCWVDPFIAQHTGILSAPFLNQNNNVVRLGICGDAVDRNNKTYAADRHTCHQHYKSEQSSHARLAASNSCSVRTNITRVPPGKPVGDTAPFGEKHILARDRYSIETPSNTASSACFLGRFFHTLSAAARMRATVAVKRYVIEDHQLSRSRSWLVALAWLCFKSSGWTVPLWSTAAASRARHCARGSVSVIRHSVPV